MATAYATFANGGHRIQPYFIEQIYNYDNKLLFQAKPQQACALCFNEQLDGVNKKLTENYEAKIAEGKVGKNKKPSADENKDTDIKVEENSSIESAKTELSIYDASPESDRLKAPVVQYVRAEQAPRILQPRVAFEMADILRDVIQRGTAFKARSLGRNDIGGKTGTTNEAKDAWFAGFHPTNATVVWMGFDQPSTLGRREYGGVAALPVWMDFMRAQLKDTPSQWVSINNRAKSKKQKQSIIEMMDEGVNETDDEDNDIEKSEKPVKTSTQQRQAPAPKAVETPQDKNVAKKPTNNSSANSPVQKPKPLTVTPVERMPSMPE